MSHACGCGAHGHEAPPLTIATTPSSPSPERTVADVSRDPRALEVLQRMGINHCCGGHLTLREAAASAGADLEALLAALGRVGAPTA